MGDGVKSEGNKGGYISLGKGNENGEKGGKDRKTNRK